MSIRVKNKDTGEVVAKEVRKETKSGPVLSAELSAFLKNVEKQAPQVITKASEILPIRRIPTGVFEFDFATGGGFPEGRISVVYGPESSGKTNIVLKAIANVQKRPPPCNKAAFVDIEGTFDPSWAAQMGVDVEELILVKPQYGEQAVDIVSGLVEIDQIAMIAYDSIAATISSREAEASTEKADVGTQAILIKRLTNKVVLSMNKEAKRNHFPALVCINQTRMKIGVMFGDPETTPGGNTIKFASSLTVRLYGRSEMVKAISSEVPVFKNTSMKIKKAKVGIIQADTEYSLCMLAHDVLNVGESASYGMVESHLKNLGLLVKGNKGWEIGGEVYRTLKDVSTRYYTEEDFRLKLQDLVIKNSAGAAILIGNEYDNVAPEDVPDELREGSL